MTYFRNIEDSEYLAPYTNYLRILKSGIENQQRFMKMFSTDEEIHNQESQQIMLPIWVPILVSVLTGFALGIGKSQNYFTRRNFRNHAVVFLKLRLIESFGHCRSEKMWSQKQRKIKNICERPKT